MSGTKAGASKAVATMLKSTVKTIMQGLVLKVVKPVYQRDLQVIVSEQGLQASKVAKQG